MKKMCFFLLLMLLPLTAEAAGDTGGEQPSIIDLSPYYYVNELAAEGTVVGTLTVVDKDKNEDGEYETLTYRIFQDENSNVESNVFEMVETANDKGVRTVDILVKKNATLDYETKSQYVTKIEIRDMLNTYVTETLTVRLRNVNEAPTAGDQTFAISEKQPNGTSWPGGKFVGKITTVADPDDDPLTYELVDAAGLPFAMKAGTNEIVVVAGDKLDFETKKSYDFKVKASDGELSTTFSVTVGLTDVNEAPVIDQLEKDYSVDENAETGTVVGTFTVYDFDQEKLTYTLSETMADIFEVVETANQNGTRTASIRVKNQLLLDYEALYKTTTQNATYPVTITVKDSRNQSATATTSIAVQDVNETFTAAGGTFYIQEHSPGLSHVGAKSYDEYLSESDYGRVTGVDADKYSKAFGTLTFAMSTENTGSDADDAKSFVVDPDDGSIYTSIDAEFEADGDGAKKEYTFKVTVSDGTFSKDVSVTVKVLDIEEALANEENHAPVAEDLTVVVDETIEGGTVVGTISASDPDAATSTVVGFYTLHYSIVDPTGLPFEIDQQAGVIKLKKNERLHYAEKDKYEFNVKVSDRATSEKAQSTIAKVTINVKDVNEPPEFIIVDSYYDVDENVTVGTTMEGKQIVVYDEDNSDVDQLKFIITDKDATTALDAAKLFEVVQVGKTNENHESTFVIKTKAGLDYEALYRAVEKGAVCNITLTIVDTEARTKYPQFETKIRVNDVNEEPAFQRNSYGANVREDVNSGICLVTVQANDPDIYNRQFGTLTFSLEGDDATLFWIDPSTGDISTVANANYDYETKPTYEFYAVVTDNTFTVKAPVNVNVENVDESPVFTDKMPVLTVDENTTKGTLVGVVVADDDDCKNNHTAKIPSYTLTATDISANDYKSFSVDQTTGSIKVAKDCILNYELKSHYSVRVVATDGDDPTLSTSVDAIIKINDVNDEPFFSDKEYVLEVREDAEEGTPVGTVAANDEDCWNEFTYTFSDYVSDSGDASMFTIDNEGKISLAEKLNYEKQKTYQLVVRATDNGESRGFKNLSAVTLATIIVTDCADAPVFTGVADLYEVDDDAAVGTVLNSSIEVTDEDKGQIMTLIASIKDQNEAATVKAEDKFDVTVKQEGDKWTLVIEVKDELNYFELYNPTTKDALFHVTLAVEDADRLLTTAETAIRVNGKKPEITFGEGQTWRTYYNADKSLLVPDGVKAYVVSGLNAAGTSVVLTPVSYLKKGVALLLEKSGGATTEYDPSDPFDPNLLKHATAAVVATTGHFVLYYNEFLKATGIITQGKNYLDLTDSGSAGARSLGIDDGDATAIGHPQPTADNEADAKWYDLQGRRIQKPDKPGLYIKNRKKVVISTSKQ